MTYHSPFHRSLHSAICKLAGGTAAAIGTAAGGYIAEHFSPRICFAATTVALFVGYFIISSGKRHLKSADHIPTREEDVAAMEDNVDKTR